MGHDRRDDPYFAPPDRNPGWAWPAAFAVAVALVCLTLLCWHDPEFGRRLLDHAAQGVAIVGGVIGIVLVLLFMLAVSQ